MIKNEIEIWKSHPDIPGVEISTFGNVRTLDKVVSSEKMTRFTEGHVLKQHDNGNGYLQVNIQGDWNVVRKYVHRMVAKTFITNPDDLPQVNHKDCDRTNNNVSNLEWCTGEYNTAYKEKYGTSAKESVPKSPVYAVNLNTQETLWFESQIEASRKLGVNQGNINNVIKGKQKQTGGFLFTSADDNGCKLTNIKNSNGGLR